MYFGCRFGFQGLASRLDTIATLLSTKEPEAVVVVRKYLGCYYRALNVQPPCLQLHCTGIRV